MTSLSVYLESFSNHLQVTSTLHFHKILLKGALNKPMPFFAMAKLPRGATMNGCTALACSGQMRKN